MALVKIGNIKGGKGDKGDKGEPGIIPTSIDRRLDVMEEIASEPGTRLENNVIDPAPFTTVDTWVAGNATLQQATETWGRAIATGGAATSVYAKGGAGSGEDSKARMYPGDKVAARLTLRAMDGQKLSATLNLVGYTWNGTAFVGRTTIATSGQLHIEPGAVNAVTFEAVGSVPVGTALTHFELSFTFRRFGETYPAAGDFVYFRQAALYSGPNAKSPVPYIDGNSSGAFWVGAFNASASIRLVARTSGGSSSDLAGQAALAHAVLLDDWSFRCGGIKRIGAKTSYSVRVDHGLANFNAKLRPILEALNIPYTIAIAAESWGLSENAGVTPAMVNSWVAGGLCSIASHGWGNHLDTSEPVTLQKYVVQSKASLEADIPAAAPIDIFMPPGASGSGGYGGLLPSTTPAAYFGTYAGQLALMTYPLCSGQFSGTAYRVQDGRPRVGQSYFNMDTFTASQVMNRVNTAITDGRGIQLMIHPSLIDTAGHITTADLQSLFDQLATLQASGKLLAMSVAKQYLADSSTI